MDSRELELRSRLLLDHRDLPRKVIRSRYPGLAPEGGGLFDVLEGEGRAALRRAAQGYDPARGPFERYARRAIHHACISFLRQWFRGYNDVWIDAHQAIDRGLEDHEEDNAAERTRKLAVAQRVYARLDEVNPTFCHLLLLRYGYGLRWRAIGKELGCGHETARRWEKTALKLARAWVREMLTEEEEKDAKDVPREAARG